MDYETLDNIADSYIPVLAIFSLLVMVAAPPLQLNRVKTILIRAAVLASLLSIAYGFMFLDNAFHWWPALGLDYSTHMAVSLGLILFLCLFSPKLLLLWIISLLLYSGLMIYQNYHSLADIMSTAFAFFIAFAVIFFPIFISTKAKKLNTFK